MRRARSESLAELAVSASGQATANHQTATAADHGYEFGLERTSTASPH